MENPKPSPFEVALLAAKSKAAGALKASDIKRLIKLLGKRPTRSACDKPRNSLRARLTTKSSCMNFCVKSKWREILTSL